MPKKMKKIYETRLKKLQAKLVRGSAFKFIKELFKKFPESEVYLVGGAVRDVLLGKEKQKDFDFVVREVAINNLEKFLKARGNVVLVGKNFGVFKFMPRRTKLEEAIDIALPRTEHSLGSGGGYKDFSVQSDPAMPVGEDLSRRDFTVNAMAWDLKNKKLVDPFGGLADLDKKILRAVGESEARFKEDYSRMLRGLRFAVQLNFSIEEKTFAALKKMMARINDERKSGHEKERVVPYETIAKETSKAFWQNPPLAFDLFEQSGALYELIPEIFIMKGCPQPANFHSEGDVWTHTKLAMRVLVSPKFIKQFGKEKPPAEVVFAVLFHDLGKPLTIKTPEKDGTDRIRFDGHDVAGAEAAEAICRRLKLDSFPDDSPLKVSPARVGQMIGKHMLLVQGKIKEMRQSTVEKYFFNANFPGLGLLQVAFSDALATIPEVGQPDLTNFKEMLARINGLKRIVAEKNRLPPPILDGNKIMKNFKLSPGPRIGELLGVLREAQLSGELGGPKTALKEKEKTGLMILKKYLAKKKNGKS